MMNTELSNRWRYGVVFVALAGLSVLLWIALNTYTGGVGTRRIRSQLSPKFGRSYRQFSDSP